MSDLSEDAKYLMNNAAFVQALQSAKAQALAVALACGPTENEARRVYLDGVRIVDKVAAHITALISADQPTEVDVTDYYTEQAKSRFAKFLTGIGQ